MTQVLGHLGWPGGAVEAHDVGAHRIDDAESGGDLGAVQHAAGELDGDLDLQGDFAPDGRHRPAGPDHTGLEAEEVELRLDEQEIDASVEQPARLFLVRVAELRESDLSERRELRARSHRSGDVTVVPVGHLAGDLGGLQVDLVGLVGDAVLAEWNGERTEGRRLDDVDPHREEVLVHLGDEIGPREHEHLVAAFERRPAEVVGGQALLLHVGAERAVVDQDAFPRRVDIGRLSRHSGKSTGPNLRPLMRIYTRKGDDGTTGLFYGGRVAKDAPGPSAYGVVDEAQAVLG